ncbi:hypothetical protein [Dyella acidisoli]|uniref:Uncharacterized protein n=1 Tax=Dyella acidisoli TaxID=1867834 RepID=A0ABQ5XLA9_9GAMM|nr:hypothetical protein [Dyella acidisoli]GLQ91996.1 hypothetical protein GCM10007901_09470 [Dyella acidisoli]
MALKLVDDDLDVSFEIPLNDEARYILSVQLQRASEAKLKPQFEERLCERLQELVDADLRPPTSKQVAYALDIARNLDVSLPSEALRHKGSMFEFLDRYAPLYKERCKPSHETPAQPAE